MTKSNGYIKTVEAFVGDVRELEGTTKGKTILISHDEFLAVEKLVKKVKSDRTQMIRLVANFDDLVNAVGINKLTGMGAGKTVGKIYEIYNKLVPNADK